MGKRQGENNDTRLGVYKFVHYPTWAAIVLLYVQFGVQASNIDNLNFLRTQREKS